MKMIRRLTVIFAVGVLALNLVQVLVAAGISVRDERGKPREIDSLIADVSTARVVFIGESHDRYDEHLSELEIIRHLYERDPQRWAIGVEFIQRPFQTYLDDYISRRDRQKRISSRGRSTSIAGDSISACIARSFSSREIIEFR